MPDKRLAYTGSLDMATVTQFLHMVQQAAAGSETLLVDMSGVTFIDSTGVRGLVSAKQQLAADGRQLILEGFSQDILDILEILGIREMIVGR